MITKSKTGNITKGNLDKNEEENKAPTQKIEVRVKFEINIEPKQIRNFQKEMEELCNKYQGL